MNPVSDPVCWGTQSKSRPGESHDFSNLVSHARTIAMNFAFSAGGLFFPIPTMVQPVVTVF